jgi:hypothetical protein
VASLQPVYTVAEIMFGHLVVWSFLWHKMDELYRSNLLTELWCWICEHERRGWVAWNVHWCGDSDTVIFRIKCIS